ncbi:MAG TPA: CapA family protein [Candidatus Paceibacterota bacterium]|nr:CapA family protein [Candidatus Paceibacterota bacterium]
MTKASRSILFYLLCVVIVIAGETGIYFFKYGFTHEETDFEATPPPLAIHKDETTLLFVGDIMLSRDVGMLMASKNDFTWPFQKSAAVLSSADLTFANLENPVSTGGVKVGSIYSFRADPQALAGLQYAGIDVVSIANNHIWDYGSVAFSDTLDNLASAGIAYVGGGQNAAAAHDGVVEDANGLKVGLLAYTNLLPAGVAATDMAPGAALVISDAQQAQMVQDIQKIKLRADFVVVSFHWGDEYQPTHNALQEKLGHLAVDAGADLVIGHHPHVVQDIEQYKGVPIVYSLGNFVFDQNFSFETTHALAVRAVIKDQKLERLDRLPVEISNEFQPAIGSE